MSRGCGVGEGGDESPVTAPSNAEPGGTTSGALRTGSRRAVPVEPVLAVDPAVRAALLEQALADPDRRWWVQEFDGRDFRTVCTVDGPAARAAYLAGEDLPGTDDNGRPRASDP